MPDVNKFNTLTFHCYGTRSTGSAASIAERARGWTAMAAATSDTTLPETFARSRQRRGRDAGKP